MRSCYPISIDPLKGVTGTISLTWSFCLVHVVNGKRGCNLPAAP